MKILLYSANFAPEPTGIGKYSGEMVEWLTQQGHEVRVVAAPPYYPDWKVAEGYSWPPYRKERIGGAWVWRAPLWVPRQPTGVKRIFHLLSFALTSAPVMLRQVAWQPDLVVTVAPAFVCAPVGWLTARLSRAKSWLHVQDFEVDVAFGMGFLKGSWLRSAALKAEGAMMRCFDVASSISGSMVDRLRQKGVLESRVRLFPNWVDVNVIRPLGRLSDYRTELGISAHDKVVLYSGTLGGKHGLRIIPEVARLLAHRTDIVFVICGDGVLKQELETLVQGMPNVRMLPLQPLERLSELLGVADIHLLPQTAEAEDLVLPSKITGMLSSGRPVVATCGRTSEIARVLSTCGVVTQPGDAMALAAALAGLSDADDQRLAMGKRARLYAEQYLSIDGVLSIFCKEARCLINSESPPPPAAPLVDECARFSSVSRDVVNLNK